MKIGIIQRAKEAANKLEFAQQDEQQKLEDLYKELEKNTDVTGSWNDNKNVNKPKLAVGMTPIKFEFPTEDKMGETKETTENDEGWYEYGTTYETKRWANAKTQDGSMWVWIPRFAYRINKDTQTTDVVFLVGATDAYYDENGKLQLAKRARTIDEKIDTTTGYTVHPAFTDETSISFRNGGWDEELTGIWVAKFEAGYASGNNSAKVVASNVNYSQNTSYVQQTERGQTADETEVARNWLDGIYAVKNADGTYSWKDGMQTAIKYPVFQGTTYSMNYINLNDAYNIARHLTDSGNIYGLTNITDSHLMKNSEWGAITYLSKSKYGLNSTDITINNINLNSGNTKRTEETKGGTGTVSVYAITGCTTNSYTQGAVIETIENIKSVSGNTKTTSGVYVWNQKTGQNASSTGTIYGIYDLSGGTWERIPAYITNKREELKTYGASIAYNGEILKTESTKYTTAYPYDANEGKIEVTASQRNYLKNYNESLIYGDSVLETSSSNAGTSNSGWNISSWYSDYSFFLAYSNPFFVRGGIYWHSDHAGLCAFDANNGFALYYSGFRVVLVY